MLVRIIISSSILMAGTLATMAWSPTTTDAEVPAQPVTCDDMPPQHVPMLRCGTPNPEEAINIISCGPAPAPEPLPCRRCPPSVRTPQFRSHDFTENRSHGMPVGTMQIVTFYDGANTHSASIAFEYDHPQLGRAWLALRELPASTSNQGRLGTFEYDLAGATLTGRVRISGIEPNGVIDGLAFGVIWRDATGFHTWRSIAPSARQHATMVGAWPIALHEKQFIARTPYLSSGMARQQAKVAIFGAEYLNDGTYVFELNDRVQYEAVKRYCECCTG
ncbi:MAG: hypothetical protein AAF432_14670 [Planctomycetota bacterium]